MTATSFRPTYQELASFERLPRQISVVGPASLMRLVCRNPEARNIEGRFWFNDRYFWRVVDFLTRHHDNLPLINHYMAVILRDGLAICYDWNNFGSIYLMNIPDGKSVEAFVGRARPQPHFSSAPGSSFPSSDQLFAGGEFQYVVELTGVAKSFIRGPFPVGIGGIGHA